VIAGVDPLPAVTGFGTNSLQLTFLGTGAAGGQLPAGTYNLNFVGNSLVVNGRGLDGASTGTGPSNTTIEFTVAASATGDFDGDGDVDGRDFLRWQRGGSPNPLSASDLALWKATYGMTGLLLAESTAVERVELAAPEVTPVNFPSNAWIVLPNGLIGSKVSASTVEEEEEIEESFSEGQIADAVFTAENESSEVLAWIVKEELEEEESFSDEAFAEWDAMALLV
jgi:hypothetical protein